MCAMIFKILILRCLLCVFLSGCSIEPTSRAMLDAYRVINPESASVQTEPRLNPNFSYLRVQVDEREFFMVLGAVESAQDGPVQVWYDASRDVLRLRDGRVVGATLKTGTNWLAVSFTHLPRWEAVVSQVAFDRSRDVSPGYQYGIKEKMLIRRVSPPDDSNLRLIPASSLAWFEESVQGDADARPARYAVSLDGGGTHQVVYAEQCLSSEFCFSWQIWPSSKKGTR